MPVYYITAEVEQKVKRKVKMEVYGDSEEDALYLAEDALKEFPRKIVTGRIHKMLSINDQYDCPTDIDFTEVREEQRFA